MSNSYVQHVASRVVRMFELYSRTIDPDDPQFQTYIEHYLSEVDPRTPEAIPYSELYKIIKKGIRDYIHRAQRQKEDQTNET